MSRLAKRSASLNEVLKELLFGIRITVVGPSRQFQPNLYKCPPELSSCAKSNGDILRPTSGSQGDR